MSDAYIKPINPVFLYVDSGSVDNGVLELHFAPSAEDKFKGSMKTGEVVFTQHPDRTKIDISLGKPEKIILDSFRQAGGEAARWLINHKVASAALDVAAFDQLSFPNALEAVCEGLLLGGFQFDRHKGKTETLTPLSITLYNASPSVEALVAKTTLICEAVNLARDWAHEPANVINPVTLAERAVKLAELYGLEVSVLDDGQLTDMGAGAITAVGKGSSTPARMIIMKYPGQGSRKSEKPVVLVGKAITFDTGGYSLKDTTNIQKMKYDKCGGINVLAVMKAAASLKFERPLVGIVCAAENMISGVAYRPDDIIRSLSGKTIEIITTDAEGRLVLCDGLTYAQQNFTPHALIDMATLTGGVVTALGRVRGGLFSNNPNLSEALSAAGDAVHERLWPLPLDDDYFPYIKGDDGDLKNSGGREGHPIMGGIFLKQFIQEDIPWAHLDIAGVADTPKDLPYIPKGATGFGVRLLLNYLQSLE